MTTPNLIFNRQDESLDAVIFRALGRVDAPLLAATYQLNKGLANLALKLPTGTAILLPNATALSTLAPQKNPTRLWE
jgi:phage tail protein X